MQRSELPHAASHPLGKGGRTMNKILVTYATRAGSTFEVAVVVAAAAAGVFSETPGAHVSFVTVRGEHAIYQGSGLYRYDPASVAREGVVWDVIDLILALPLFAVAIVLSLRGSLRGRLGLCGMLFYFVYKYLMYAVMVAFNPLFLVCVAIFALSAVAFF